MGLNHEIRRIAIIGAGPAGLAAAKYLLAEKAFDVIDIFEQRDRVGGVWVLSETKQSSHLPVPQLDPYYGTQRQASSHGNASNGNEGGFNSIELESPLYDYLEANIPKSMMAYSDLKFPEAAPIFPGHQVVLNYLEEYSKGVTHLIHFNTKVLDVRKAGESSGGPRWHVFTEKHRSGNQSTSLYDAVVVANGHYSVPYIPDIKGITEWNQSYPHSIMHSKAYRVPEDFRGKKVLVIGNSASGTDISAQISEYCHQPLFLSSRSVSPLFRQALATWKVEVPELVEFLPSATHDRAVRFADGKVEAKFDAVIFATGYFYSFPFLSNLTPPLIGNGFFTHSTYRHLFHSRYPTLAFPLLNLKIIPFPLAEAQMSVVARVWSGRLQLPPQSKMIEWESQTLAERGEFAGRHFHSLRPGEDGEMINSFGQWARSAEKTDGLENGGVGKLSTLWGKEDLWLREQIPLIKDAFAARGAERFVVRNIQDLGFDYGKSYDD